MFDIDLSNVVGPLLAGAAAVLAAVTVFFTGKSAGKTESKIENLEAANAIKAAEDVATQNAPTTESGVSDELSKGKF